MEMVIKSEVSAPLVFADAREATSIENVDVPVVIVVAVVIVAEVLSDTTPPLLGFPKVELAGAPGAPDMALTPLNTSDRPSFESKSDR